MEWRELSDRIFIFTAFMVLLVGSVAREAARMRKERYVHTFDKLHAIGSKIKDLNTYLARQFGKTDSLDAADLKKVTIGDLEVVLDNLSDIFTIVISHVCRTTIKVIHREGDTIYLYVLARDSQSTAVNARSDKERWESRADKLEENEDFWAIFEEKVDYFLENNLPARRDYRNSSFQVYGARPLGTSLITRWFTSIGWTLPYKSAIVFPIRQLEPASGGVDDVGCIGFLSVDCPSRWVFKRRFDGPLGATVASALFHPISVYMQLIGRIEQQGTE